jgi:hypothetical protein
LVVGLEGTRNKNYCACKAQQQFTSVNNGNVYRVTSVCLKITNLVTGIVYRFRWVETWFLDTVASNPRLFRALGFPNIIIWRSDQEVWPPLLRSLDTDSIVKLYTKIIQNFCDNFVTFIFLSLSIYSMLNNWSRVK